MTRELNSEQDRRIYWTETMDAAWGFMGQVLDFPVDDSLEPLVWLPEIAAKADIPVAFSEVPRLDGSERHFFVRRGLVNSLLAAAEAFARKDQRLLVEDTYRFPETQRGGTRSGRLLGRVLKLTRWELGGDIPDTELFMRRLSVYTATCPKFANHTAGSAVDISVLDKTGNVLERGGVYPEFSLATPMDTPFISRNAQKNRRMINEIMASHGFHAYPFEFWHYSLGDADAAVLTKPGDPAQYGPVTADVETGEVMAVANPLEWFVSRDHIEKYLAAQQ